MTYNKPIMQTSELLEMGFSKGYLMQMAHVEGQKYCFCAPGGRKFLWDTERFERERVKLAIRNA